MTRLEMVGIIREKNYAVIHDCNLCDTRPKDDTGFYYLSMIELVNIIREYEPVDDVIVETMTDINDNEIDIISFLPDIDGTTDILFIDGDIKEFTTYEKACAYAYRRGYID